MNLSVLAGADFVKTSTGFSTGGATEEDVKLMRAVVGPEMGVKASGGVRSFEDMKKMIDAGATRIGASSGVQIMQGLQRILIINTFNSLELRFSFHIYNLKVLY